jgi:hypothetical protein
MRYFSVIGLCVIVAGCSLGTSDRIAHQESPDERMTRIVLAGRQECETKFPTSPRRNHLAQARCVVEFNERVVMPQDQFPDLVGKLNATRLVVAEKQDKSVDRGSPNFLGAEGDTYEPTEGATTDPYPPNPGACANANEREACVASAKELTPMDAHLVEATIKAYLTEIRSRLDKAAGIGRAADACRGRLP